MPNPKEGQPPVRIDMPHRTQEFLDIVGSLQKAVPKILPVRKKANNPSSYPRFI